MMKYKIAVIKGDGIGPEIVEEAVKALKAIGDKFAHEFSFMEVLMGGCAYESDGVPLPEETLNICRSSDAVLFGAVGGPKWEKLPAEKRPEAGLLRLRKELNLFANLRPAFVYPELQSACPIKDGIIGDGLDIMIVRELTGGIYFGERGRCIKNGEDAAYDIMQYSRSEIERVGRRAFDLAMKRNKRLVSVDKANVLECSRLWRETMHKLKEEYREVSYSDMYVDNASMQLVFNPRQFDVIVTENLFGDILSDEASMITGSIGMLPSANLGDGTFGMYEPIHGSAPDLAGKGIANPIATILSCAMMLRLSLGLNEEASCLENAVKKALISGIRTKDIAIKGETPCSTGEMGEAVLKQI